MINQQDGSLESFQKFLIGLRQLLKGSFGRFKSCLIEVVSQPQFGQRFLLYLPKEQVFGFDRLLASCWPTAGLNWRPVVSPLLGKFSYRLKPKVFKEVTPSLDHLLTTLAGLNQPVSYSCWLKPARQLSTKQVLGAFLAVFSSSFRLLFWGLVWPKDNQLAASKLSSREFSPPLKTAIYPQLLTTKKLKEEKALKGALSLAGLASSRPKKIGSNRRAPKFFSTSLSQQQLASLYRWPTPLVAANLNRQLAKSLPLPARLFAPPALGDFFVGENDHHARRQKIYLPKVDRFRHVYLLGATGVGKTTLLKNKLLETSTKEPVWRLSTLTETWLANF